MAIAQITTGELALFDGLSICVIHDYRSSGMCEEDQGEMRQRQRRDHTGLKIAEEAVKETLEKEFQGSFIFFRHA